jgi:thiol-disulfide isomerase/thioredoxin
MKQLKFGLMNKKFLLFFVIIIAVTSCKKDMVQITGKLIDPVKDEYIYLDILKSDQLEPADSVIVNENGEFAFKTKVESSAFYLLKINESNFMTMLLEPNEKIDITVHHDSLNYPRSITGSYGTELMTSFNKKLRGTINQLMGLNEIYEQNIESPELPLVIEKLDSMAQSYMNDLNIYTKKYIDDNQTSLVTLVALYQQVAPGQYILQPANDLEYFIKVDSTLSALYPGYEPVITLHEQVQNIVSEITAKQLTSAATADGVVAPEIALPSPQGDTIKLSSTRGYVVLLDFWASWCSPCRQENPNLLKAYNQYRSKGFRIYQVSLDKTKEAWLKGIEEDHLEKWVHVSDVQYWSSVVVPLYGLESIPANFLLDREGRIIASNLRGEELQRKLAEVFNK